MVDYQYYGYWLALHGVRVTAHPLYPEVLVEVPVVSLASAAASPADASACKPSLVA